MCAFGSIRLAESGVLNRFRCAFIFELFLWKLNKGKLLNHYFTRVFDFTRKNFRNVEKWKIAQTLFMNNFTNNSNGDYVI